METRFLGAPTMIVVFSFAMYLFAVLLFGALARRRAGATPEGYVHFVAGGRLSAAVTACTMTATSVGGSSIVVATALVYQHGLAGVWFELAGALGLVALGLFLARRVRETGVASIAELAGRRHGARVRRGVALVVLFAEVGWLALQAKAATLVLGPALPRVSSSVITSATLGIVVLYTFLGGQLAVSYADLVQITVMLLGLVVLAPIAATRAVGGLAGLRQLRWDFPTSPTFGWLEVGSFLVLTGLPHLVGSDIYAKVLSARDGRSAARGALAAAALKVLVALGLALCALCGARLFPDLTSPGQVIGQVVYRVFPPVLTAVVAVALLAVLQSTASQLLLSAVTMVGNDLWPGRWSIALTTFGVGLGAFALAELSPTVIDLMKVAYTIFAAGLALPVLTSVLPEVRLPRWAVLTAIASGSVVGGGLHFARLAGFAPLPGDPVLWGTLCSFLCLASGAVTEHASIAR